MTALLGLCMHTTGYCNLHLRFFFIVNLVKDRGDVVGLVYGFFGSLRSKFVSYAHTSKLEHNFVVFDAAMGRIMSKVDDEEIGNESSNDDGGGINR